MFVSVRKLLSLTSFFVLPLFLIVSPHALFSDQGISEEDLKEETSSKEVQIAKISEAFGHLIAKNMESLGLDFNIDQVVKGLKDSASGKNPPMSEMECVEAISSIQEKNFKQQATNNLAAADEFMKANAEKDGIVSLENGKLQYKVEAQGQGSIVEEHCSPLIRYTGKYLDGTIFGSSQKEEVIPLDETIAGISKGLIGMKEGEKRTLYIHPDLGYGTNGLLVPNSLLTFEIEIVKAHAPFSEEVDALTKSTHQNNDRAEIATPLEEPTVVR